MVKIRNILTAMLACCLLLTSSCGTPDTIDGGHADNVDLPEHFMVNGTVYWETSALSGTMPGSFKYAGEIREMLNASPAEDWQSYSLPLGAKIYLDPDIPCQAWVDGDWRFATAEAGRAHLMHNGSLYVYLGDVQSYDGEYYAQYRNDWQLTVDFRALPYDCVYLGDTVFEGYDLYPVKELGSSAFTDPRGVYAYSADENILFAETGAGDAYVYVKLPE